MHGHISARFFKFLQGSSLGQFSKAHWGPLDAIFFFYKRMDYSFPIYYFLFQDQHFSSQNSIVCIGLTADMGFCGKGYLLWPTSNSILRFTTSLFITRFMVSMFYFLLGASSIKNGKMWEFFPSPQDPPHPSPCL